MKQTYNNLRKELKYRDIDRPTLAIHLGMSLSTLDNRFSKKKEHAWRLDEIYKILDILKIEHHRLHEFFPMDGAA